jgi:hypothetical protein
LASKMSGAPLKGDLDGPQTQGVPITSLHGQLCPQQFPPLMLDWLTDTPSFSMKFCSVWRPAEHHGYTLYHWDLDPFASGHHSYSAISRYHKAFLLKACWVQAMVRKGDTRTSFFSQGPSNEDLESEVEHKVPRTHIWSCIFFPNSSPRLCCPVATTSFQTFPILHLSGPFHFRSQGFVDCTSGAPLSSNPQSSGYQDCVERCLRYTEEIWWLQGQRKAHQKVTI